MTPSSFHLWLTNAQHFIVASFNEQKGRATIDTAPILIDNQFFLLDLMKTKHGPLFQPIFLPLVMVFHW